VSAKFWLSFLVTAVTTVTNIGSLADSKHRALFAQDLGAETDTQDVDAVYFSTAGLSNEILVIFPADHSIAHCDQIVDFLAHGDGAPSLAKEGFLETEFYNHKQTIDDNARGNIQGASLRCARRCNPEVAAFGVYKSRAGPIVTIVFFRGDRLGTLLR
jgi:hypothetical protein